MDSSLNRLAAVCAMATVASTFASADFETPLYTNSDTALTGGLFEWRYNIGTSTFQDGFQFLPAVQMGPNVSPVMLPTNDLPAVQHALFGLFGDGSVFVALNADAAKRAQGQDFMSVFGVEESTVANALANPNVDSQALIHNVFMNNISLMCDGSVRGQLVGFSVGEPHGDYQLGTTPEPASLGALGLGVLALIRRRRTV